MGALDVDTAGLDLAELARELTAGVRRVALHFAERPARGRPRLVREVVLQRDDECGLAIGAQTQRIDERLEVGRLTVRPAGRDGRADEQITLPAVFGAGLAASKLVVEEAGWTVTAGITLRAADGTELTIVAGDVPATIAIRGPGVEVTLWPEFDWDLYRRIPFR